MPNVMGTVSPRPLHHRSLRHHLPVGFFSDVHHPPRVADIEGEMLGSIIRIRMVNGPEGQRVPVTERMVLYYCVGDWPYVVHSVLERPDQVPMKLGLVERCLGWNDLADRFPSLASRALEVSRDWALEHRPTVRPTFVEDHDDPSTSFG